MILSIKLIEILIKIKKPYPILVARPQEQIKLIIITINPINDIKKDPITNATYKNITKYTNKKIIKNSLS